MFSIYFPYFCGGFSFAMFDTRRVFQTIRFHERFSRPCKGWIGYIRSPFPLAIQSFYELLMGCPACFCFFFKGWDHYDGIILCWYMEPYYPLLYIIIQNYTATLCWALHVISTQGVVFSPRSSPWGLGANWGVGWLASARSWNRFVVQIIPQSMYSIEASMLEIDIDRCIYIYVYIYIEMPSGYD